MTYDLQIKAKLAAVRLMGGIEEFVESRREVTTGQIEVLLRQIDAWRAVLAEIVRLDSR